MKFIKILVNRFLGSFGYRALRVEQPDHTAKLLVSEKIGDVNGEKFILESENKKLETEKRQGNFRSRFKRYHKSHDIIKLHFGSGPRILKDWVNIDLAYEPFEKYMQYYTEKYYPENIRGSENDFYAFDPTGSPLPIPNNSVDVIFHEDFFEHINQRNQVAFLAETLRVLKKGGIHRINTPDLVRSMKDNSEFSKGFKGVYFNEWDGHEHLSVTTQVILRELALLVGYSKVIFNSKNKSTSPLVPLEYRPDPKDRPLRGNVYADLIK